MTAEERAKELMTKLITTIYESRPLDERALNEAVLEALRAQDAETERRTRHACAEAVQDAILVHDHPAHRAANYAGIAHTACMNAEVKD
jgi:hypothetical protein